MSGPDQDKGFLARWAQRKSEVRQPEPDADVVAADVTGAPVVEAEAPPEFDLASLPKLEELTSTTDITGFLRKGVPEQLRNAALRKSWALDPAIRNYVNPALEYAYDWNTPGGVPGNSEIAVGTDIAKMVLQIMGSGETTTEAATPGIQDDAARAMDHAVDQAIAGDVAAEPVRLSEDGHTPSVSQDKSEPMGAEVDRPTRSEEAGSVAPHQVLRRHGSAKPSV